jgi:hypothetical protein
MPFDSISREPSAPLPSPQPAAGDIAPEEAASLGPLILVLAMLAGLVAVLGAAGALSVPGFR